MRRGSAPLTLLLSALLCGGLFTPRDATAASWTQSPATGPAARESHAMAFDSARGVTVMFGGEVSNGSSIPYGDTWLFDGTNWMPGPGGPSARWSHAMAFDSVRGVSVLFGGGPSANVNDETWLFDGSSWAQSPASGPAPRGHHAMAFDSSRNVTVLFGGYQPPGTPIYGDTWLFDGNTWTEFTGAGPPARFFHAMAYDSVHNATVLFGGTDNTVLFGDTWLFDGSTWRQVTGPGPSARVLHRMVFDSARGVTVLFGGNDSSGGDLNDTWEFDGASWNLVDTGVNPPPARRGHAVAFDSERGKTILFGGQDGGILFFDDTWELSEQATAIVGCADGEREGFVDLSTYLNIAGCSGGWNIPGIHTANPGISPICGVATFDTTTPACGRGAGDDGTNADGTGCNVADLCAEGWHVCASAAEVATNSPTGCLGAALNSDPPLFFATRQTSNGCGLCATGTRMDSDCNSTSCTAGCAQSASTSNDVFGCGNFGGGLSLPALTACSPLDRASHDQCSELDGSIWSCPNTNCEAFTVTKSDPSYGGVLCCRNAAVSDADGDGVPDTQDQCAGTPQGELVDAIGCSCSQKTCDDGNPCNGVETCDPETASCVSGTPLRCDDGDVCNGSETCNPTTACVNGLPLSCDDGNPCNGVETCEATAGCVHGVVPPDLCKLSACASLCKGKNVVIDLRSNSTIDHWVRFIGSTVIPELANKYPDRNERLRVAAETTWWGLREGSLILPGRDCGEARATDIKGLDPCPGIRCTDSCLVPSPVTNPNLFSNCSRFATKSASSKTVSGYCGNFHLYCNPVEICDPDPCVAPSVLGGVCPWQVGIVSALVPRHGIQCTSDAICKTKDAADDALVRDKVSVLFPQRDPASVLSEAVQLAGLDPSSGVGETIVSSDTACSAALANNGNDTRVEACQLRRSWLVHHPAVGIAVEDDNVKALCVHLPRDATITNGRIDPNAPCPGTGCVGKTAGPYAKTSSSACDAQKDLFNIFFSIAP